MFGLPQTTKLSHNFFANLKKRGFEWSGYIPDQGCPCVRVLVCCFVAQTQMNRGFESRTPDLKNRGWPSGLRRLYAAQFYFEQFIPTSLAFAATAASGVLQRGGGQEFTSKRQNICTRARDAIIPFFGASVLVLSSRGVYC